MLVFFLAFSSSHLFFSLVLVLNYFSLYFRWVWDYQLLMDMFVAFRILNVLIYHLFSLHHYIAVYWTSNYIKAYKFTLILYSFDFWIFLPVYLVKYNSIYCIYLFQALTDAHRTDLWEWTNGMLMHRIGLWEWQSFPFAKISTCSGKWEIPIVNFLYDLLWVSWLMFLFTGIPLCL